MNFNAEIKQILSDLSVPIAFMYYKGNATTYVIYRETDKANSLGAEDNVVGWIAYYDIDIYSKGNYIDLMEQIRELLTGAGWTYQPSRDSFDMFETDTGYFHKTLCFCKETMI